MAGTPDFDFTPTLVGETIALRRSRSDDFEDVYAEGVASTLGARP